MSVHQQAIALAKDNKLKITGDHETNFSNSLKRSHEDEHYMNSVLLDINRAEEFSWNTRRGKPVLDDNYCFSCGEKLSYFLECDTLVPFKRMSSGKIPADTCFNVDEVSFLIQVPSGKLIFADWPKHGKDIIGHLDVREHSINSTKGVVLRTQHYASENVMHVFVGNSSPHIYEKEGVFYFGRDSYDEDDNEVPLCKGSTEVGWVCTDLWWVTGVDASIYEKMAIAKFGEEKGKQMAAEALEEADSVIDVEPGIYRCRYFVERDDDKRLHATLEKV